MALPFSDLRLELQALIFKPATDGDSEISPAYHSSPGTLLHGKVQPRMFHTIDLPTYSSVYSFQCKSPELLHPHVKHLCITFGSMSMDEGNIVLSTCTGVVDLAFWLAWPDLPALNKASWLSSPSSSARKCSTQLLR
ncbi:hypothetical protein BKA70DRAFT_1435631 [Coprinopsis sp. MPI-PUGE-AT-0042]|nr:hypothetical protein BKA70DRAFT_1435631 [Coprinopsis sp. MPI-PUGE-AT-0042]